MDNSYQPCLHPDQEVRYRQIAGHAQLIPYLQCMSCGAGIRAVKNEYVDNKIKSRKLNGDPSVFFDETLQQKWIASQTGRAREAYAEKSQERRDEYSEYRLTDEWAMRRAAVLKRDKGLCQGCLTQPATQVHHLTYAHIFNELLFELVAICDDCHAIAHADRED